MCVYWKLYGAYALGLHVELSAMHVYMYIIQILYALDTNTTELPPTVSKWLGQN